MRNNLYTCLGAMRVGLDILLNQEHVKIDKLLGHGGLFKTKGVGQQILADAVNAPVSVMSTAGEGGAWGIALLASYMINKKTAKTLRISWMKMSSKETKAAHLRRKQKA